RTYTGALRRAVIARDRHCGWPGCTQEVRWCEVHHIRWWDRDDGPTSADNGVLLCSFHHHEVHRYDYTLTRRSGEPAEPGGGERSRPPDRSRAIDVPDVGESARSGSRGAVARARYTVHARDGRQIAPSER